MPAGVCRSLFGTADNKIPVMVQLVVDGRELDEPQRLTLSYRYKLGKVCARCGH